MGVKFQLQVRAKAELRPVIFNLIYYLDEAFGATFKHSSILTRLLTSSYTPNVLLFIHSSENDSFSLPCALLANLFDSRVKHLACSGTQVHTSAQKQQGDPPHPHLGFHQTLGINNYKQGASPSHKPGENMRSHVDILKSGVDFLAK